MSNEMNAGAVPMPSSWWFDIVSGSSSRKGFFLCGLRVRCNNEKNGLFFLQGGLYLFFEYSRDDLAVDGPPEFFHDHAHQGPQ